MTSLYHGLVPRDSCTCTKNRVTFLTQVGKAWEQSYLYLAWNPGWRQKWGRPGFATYSAAHEQLVGPLVSTREWLESHTRATPSQLTCEYSSARECNGRHMRAVKLLMRGTVPTKETQTALLFLQLYYVGIWSVDYQMFTGPYFLSDTLTL